MNAKAALGQVLKLIEDGVLVRNIKDDSTVKFIEQSARLGRILKRAQESLEISTDAVSPEVSPTVQRVMSKFQDALNKRNDREFKEALLKRPMSSWTFNETHRYSILSGQPCPECGKTDGVKCCGKAEFQHDEDCPCFGDSDGNGNPVEHSMDCKNCECRQTATAPEPTEKELDRLIHTLSGQLLFVTEYIKERNYGTDENRKLAANACKRIAKNGHRWLREARRREKHLRKYKATITHDEKTYIIYTLALDLETAKNQIETKAAERGLSPYTLNTITVAGQPCHE